MAEFGFGELNEYYPEYGGVDWHSLYVTKHPTAEDRPIWFEDEDTKDYEPLMEQLTQENCCIYINKTNPDLDTITVHDPRDDTKFFFVRMHYGDAFQQIVDNIRSEVGYVESKYPIQSLVSAIFALMDTDIEEVDHIPDDWEV